MLYIRSFLTGILICCLFGAKAQQAVPFTNEKEMPFCEDTIIDLHKKDGLYRFQIGYHYSETIKNGITEYAYMPEAFEGSQYIALPHRFQCRTRMYNPSEKDDIAKRKGQSIMMTVINSGNRIKIYYSHSIMTKTLENKVFFLFGKTDFSTLDSLLSDIKEHHAAYNNAHKIIWTHLFRNGQLVDIQYIPQQNLFILERSLQ